MRPVPLALPWRALLALCAGLLVPLTLSPLSLWPLALPSLALLYLLLHDTTPRTAALLGWCYGFGLYGLGASWVYVSIHDYGAAPPPLAAALTLLFVAGLALLTLLQCWLYRRWCRAHPVFGFAALWALGEWLRSWLLTGFPWLYLGYAHVTAPLSGLAPIIGVLGIGFVLALSAALLGALWQRGRNAGWHALRGGILPALALLWLCAVASNQLDWVTPRDTPPLRVAAVQANIAQELKFDSAALEQNLQRYRDLSAPLWGHDLVLWPETAIPLLYQQATPLLTQLETDAANGNTALVSGIFWRDGERNYNSLAVLGNGSGAWHKQKLVPFGEYVPLRALLENLLQLFSLPMSSLVPGPAGQDSLQVAGWQAAAFICYEVVYPNFVRRQARDADFLLTVSNDTWFGASWGPLQHLQMAAMRARENGRYMLRATNNGVTALIDERGRILQRAPQFEVATLSGELQLFSGRTPYSRWGDWPLLLLCTGLLLWCRRDAK